MLYTGAWAGQQYVRAGAVGQQFYDPKGVRVRATREPGDSTRGGAWRSPARRTATGSTTCSSTGSARYALAAGDGQRSRGGEHSPSTASTIRSAACLGVTAPDGADNQNMSASFVSTSGILPRAEFPQFNSWPSSR